VTAPISARLNGFQVSTSPPNTQGFALLRTLRALEALGLDTLPKSVPADVLGRLFADGARVRDTLLADPEFAQTDVDNDGFDELILGVSGRGPRTTGLASDPSVPGGDTVGVAAADSRGYAVSLIQSLYDNFGSGLLEPRTGILMHNRGRSFSLDPLSPNVIVPGKRPAHTLMPVIVTVGPHVRWVNAAMGGQAQPQIHAQVLLQLLAGRSPHYAVSAPRWVVGPRAAGDRSDTVYHEIDVPRATVEALDADGFPLREVPARTQFLGHVNVISRDSDGTFTAGSDPRSDGSVAIVEIGDA
jgi:gamma-glutamyltranspeptidase/glutathione hydrolase